MYRSIENEHIVNIKFEFCSLTVSCCPHLQQLFLPQYSLLLSYHQKNRVEIPEKNHSNHF